MDTEPRCPICYGKDWEILGRKLYEKQKSSHLSEYAKIRYEVLFNIWINNTEEIQFSSILCKQCGFVAFLPRPTKEDIDRKYLYLSSHSSAKKEETITLSTDGARSSELFEYVAPFFKNKPVDVLDFGGGNGRLMSAFVSAGYACYVVDYIETALPGVKHLGCAIDDIPRDRAFDLIVCSHVLEHLAAPREIVEKLAKRLKPEGVMYIELPLEIWNEVPLPVEPVTHINFFTPRSTRALLELSGLRVISCLEDMYTTEQGGRAFAIRAVARCSEEKNDLAPDLHGNAESARKLVTPSSTMKVRRFLEYPAYRRQLIKRWAHAHLPRTFFWRFIN